MAVNGEIEGMIIIIVILTMCGRELPPAPIRQVRPCQLPPFFIHHPLLTRKYEYTIMMIFFEWATTACHKGSTMTWV